MYQEYEGLWNSGHEMVMFIRNSYQLPKICTARPRHRHT